MGMNQKESDAEILKIEISVKKLDDGSLYVDINSPHVSSVDYSCVFAKGKFWELCPNFLRGAIGKFIRVHFNADL